MISVSTFLCALALVASIFAVGVSLTLPARMRKLDGEQLRTQTALRNCAAKLDVAMKRVNTVTATTPAAVLAEVAALSVAVGKLADTQRRFQGRFDARMGREAVSERDTGSNGAAVVDEDVQAMLQLQSAPPASPR